MKTSWCKIFAYQSIETVQLIVRFTQDLLRTSNIRINNINDLLRPIQSCTSFRLLYFPLPLQISRKDIFLRTVTVTLAVDVECYFLFKIFIRTLRYVGHIRMQSQFEADNNEQCFLCTSMSCFSPCDESHNGI